jgi:hypothetical protein
VTGRLSSGRGEPDGDVRGLEGVVGDAEQVRPDGFEVDGTVARLSPGWAKPALGAERSGNVTADQGGGTERR